MLVFCRDRRVSLREFSSTQSIFPKGIKFLETRGVLFTKRSNARGIYLNWDNCMRMPWNRSYMALNPCKLVISPYLRKSIISIDTSKQLKEYKRPGEHKDIFQNLQLAGAHIAFLYSLKCYLYIVYILLYWKVIE